MRRWLYTYRIVSGSPEELAERLRRELPDMLRRAADSPDDSLAGDGSFRVRLHGVALGGIPVAKTARVWTGVAKRVRDGRVCIPLRWAADPARTVFPSFDGTVELEPQSASTAQLTLVGTYALPLSFVGFVLDATALAGVAESTAEVLIEALTDGLVAEALTDKAGQPPPSRPLQVTDVMTADPIMFVEDLSLRTAAMVLFHHGISGAPVVDAAGDLIGVLSEQDLLHKEATEAAGKEARRRTQAITVGEACSRPARTTTPDVPLRTAATEMLDRGVSRLVVIDESRVAGMLTRHDVLMALLRTDDELQAAVDDLLDRLEEPEVEASVLWGEVTLAGRTQVRSYVGAVFAAVEAIDGVLAVHGTLEWVDDDLAANLPFTPSV